MVWQGGENNLAISEWTDVYLSGRSFWDIVGYFVNGGLVPVIVSVNCRCSVLSAFDCLHVTAGTVTGDIPYVHHPNGRAQEDVSDKWAAHDLDADPIRVSTPDRVSSSADGSRGTVQ